MAVIKIFDQYTGRLRAFKAIVKLKGHVTREQDFTLAKMSQEEALRQAITLSYLWDEELAPIKRQRQLDGAVKTDNRAAVATNFYLRAQRKKATLSNGDSITRYFPYFHITRTNPTTKKQESKQFVTSKLGYEAAFNTALKVYADWYELTHDEETTLSQKMWSKEEAIERLLSELRSNQWLIDEKGEQEISKKILKEGKGH
ncbi:hypothetical protein AB4254_12130 [Vibrio breoganii]